MLLFSLLFLFFLDVTLICARYFISIIFIIFVIFMPMICHYDAILSLLLSSFSIAADDDVILFSLSIIIIDY